MKKFLTLLIFLCGIILIALVMKTGLEVRGENGVKTLEITETISGFGQEIKELTKDVDSEKASEVLAYIKEKKDDGTLKSASDIRDVLREGGEKFGVSVSEDSAAQVEETLTKLEDLGLSTDIVVDEAEKLYTKYGEEFSDHLEEAFVNAAKDAAGNAAQNLWEEFQDKITGVFH